MEKDDRPVTEQDPSTAPEESPEETQEEKKENWLYYHSAHLVVAAVLLLLIGTLIYSVVTHVPADYTVALATGYTMPQEGVEQLEACLTAYADDRNGDGKVVVSVRNYIFADTDEENRAQNSILIDFLSDCASADSMLLFHDEIAFSYLQPDISGLYRYNSGEPMPQTAVDYENAMLPWGDFKALSAFTPQVAADSLTDSETISRMLSNLRVSFCALQGVILQDEEYLAYYQSSLQLYDRLLTGEAPTAE